MFYWAKRAVLHGVGKDVVSAQTKGNILTGNLEEMPARADYYDNKAEYTYSFLQIMTAATASFTHSANDVSK
jgi:sodium-dependent phosphate transporter